MGAKDEVYATVKAYAYKGLLLAPQVLEALAESRSLDEVVTKLRGTAYARRVSQLERPYTAARVEKALKEHLYESELSLAKHHPHPELLNAYYMRHVAKNLKTVLKAKALGQSFEELSQYVELYAEELIGRRDMVVRAMAAETLEAAVSALSRGVFGEEAELALEAYRRSGRVQVFDLYIDKAFYKHLLEAYFEAEKPLSRRAAELKAVRPIVAVEVDSYNILAVLRGRLWGLSVDEVQGMLVEPTFRAGRSLLDRMAAAARVEEALEALRGFQYPGVGVVEVGGFEAVKRLEEEFKRLSYRRALEAFLRKVEGLATLLGVVKLKELEVENLSRVVFGVEAGLGLKEIMSRLMLVR